MKGIIYLFWAAILSALLYPTWAIAGFDARAELRSQLQHLDDYMNARGQYGGQQP